MRTLIGFAALAACAVGVQAAGTVQVSFVEPDKFADAGRSLDRPANLKTIEAHLQALGQRYLADGQTLNVEVLDVDLAGELRPSRHSAGEIRVARSADWPRMNLRYTLEGGGLPAQRGEDRISDPNYQQHLSSYSSRDPLKYEKQMLEAWFKTRFVPPQ